MDFDTVHGVGDVLAGGGADRGGGIKQQRDQLANKVHARLRPLLFTRNQPRGKILPNTN